MLIGERITNNSRRRSRRIANLVGVDRLLVVPLRRFHAAEAEMIGPSVDFALAACADDVARAILVVAKK